MPVDVAAYLERIDTPAPTAVDAHTLRTLQLNHLRKVPFENLSIHLSEEISLTRSGLLDKIVTRRRGGFCYELNGAFAWLLRQLGFEVTLHAARVYHGSSPGPPFDHAALVVELDEPWLVDVGFGQFADQPLRLNDRGDQHDPAGVFRIADGQHDDVIVAENGKPQYVMEMRPRDLAEFEAMCWYQQTSPKSQFTRSPICSLLTPTGRTTLSGSSLTSTTNGQSSKTLINDVDLAAAYREHFGIELDRVPNDPRNQ